jgi:hypothetical protein
VRPGSQRPHFVLVLVGALLYGLLLGLLYGAAGSGQWLASAAASGTFFVLLCGVELSDDEMVAPGTRSIGGWQRPEKCSLSMKRSCRMLAGRAN